MRKRWLFGLLVAGLLALALTAGAVMAQSDGETGPLGAKTFAGRVAAILGLDESQVQDAINQASKEAREDKLQMKLDRMVEKGSITQEQADEYRDWRLSRPEGIMPKFQFRGFGGHGGFGGRSFGEHFFKGFRFHKPAPEEGEGQSSFRFGLSTDPALTQY
tara:strand:+ start:4230 stop:4712 length:483 start_codon:yes stop_codon:yes gene_type:complete